MDTLTLSRIQFAVATYFHFLFVPLTLGLSLLVAIMETIYVRRRDDEYRRMAKFWGKLFLINFALGVVTGITLEFQFGTNWSRYSAYVGDIFGSLLAIEATAAFFLESTFIAVWTFGWKRLPARLHALAIWLVAIASNISAFWILAANGWMQNPVGYVLRNGRAELSSFFAVITSKFAILTFVHTIGGAYMLAGFFVLGISAWHLLRRNEVSFFTKSFRVAAIFTLCASVFTIGQGHMSAELVGDRQPAKFAAMEAVWETGRGAPMYLVQWPDADAEKNSVQALAVPKLLSFLASYDPNGEVRGLKSFPRDERPPVLPVFLSFRLMVGLGVALLLLALWAFLRRNELLASPRLLRILVWTIPIPYLVNELGWTVSELGRQPWIVYGLMKTRDAVSPIAVSQVLPTTIGFVLLYGLLGAVDFYLLAKVARRGPALEQEQPAPPDDDAPRAADRQEAGPAAQGG